MIPQTEDRRTREDQRVPQWVTGARLIRTLRANGASVRAIAKSFGMSKSTLYRKLPLHLAIADASDTETDPERILEAAVETVLAAVPNGTEPGMPSTQENGSRRASVPNGTPACCPHCGGAL
jgi:transposase-like protein